MTTKEKQNPKVEWGFFAVTPRIVRTQYKQLSHTEKWLYVCLKDLCGDKGMCYRTLRVLSQETDLSLGNLSVGIRHLHEAGLIHAEKKRRTNNPTAKEVWHITIVDIWQSNVEYCSKYEHSDENVQDVNNNVQNMNNPPLERSNPEQQCSNFDDRRNNTEEQHIEEITSKDTYVNADALTHTPSQETSSENENYYQHDIPTVDNSQQASTDIPIATTKPQTELIGVATRNTESLVDVPPVPAPDTSQQNGHRKPRTPKVDPDLQKRIEAVLTALDECAREVMGDADFTYRRTKVATDEVASLLKSRKVTREDLHDVYLKMWNTPVDTRTGFDWKKNMTVKAVCNNYDRMLIQIKGNAKQNGHTNNGVTTSSVTSKDVKIDRKWLHEHPV